MKNNRTTCLVQTSAFAALMALCAWISVPALVPFTLQTFGVFLAAALMGAKKGTLAVGLYIALGAAGLPVFSGGQAGWGVLLGQTGGYITGFLPGAFLCGFLAKKAKTRPLLLFGAMLAGLLCVYITGSLWFAAVYLPKDGAYNLWAAFTACVLPFVIPDILKIALAVFVVRRVSNFIK